MKRGAKKKMTKKSFKEHINPAMNFISQEESGREVVHKKIPEGCKINPLYVETKSKRLQLLIQPSLHEKLKAEAAKKNTSVNDVVNQILNEALGEK